MKSKKYMYKSTYFGIFNI